MIKKHYEKYNETVYKKTLENGLQIVLIPKNNFNKTFITFATNYGAADLSFIPIGKKNKVTQPAGIAHFLEHVLFKMPDGSDAFYKFDSIGVGSNAFTSYDKTAYIVDGTENINEALEILLDFVQTPYFTKKIIENETNIITEEINMYLDSVKTKLFNRLLYNTYKNNYLKEDIIGSVDTIKKITKEDLYKAYNTFYHPSNMSLIMTGKFDVDEVINIITTNQQKKTFKEITEIKRFKPYEPNKVNILNSVEEANTTTPLIGLSIKLKNSDDLKTQYLKAIKFGLLLDYYFSGSGEVYEQLLDKELINSGFSYYQNLYGESLSVHFVSYTNKPEELIEFLRKTLINLNRRKFNKERFMMLKRGVYGSFIRNLNSVEGINYSYLEFLPYGIDLFEAPELIDNIKIEEVFSLINEIKKETITTHTIYPKKV